MATTRKRDLTFKLGRDVSSQTIYNINGSVFSFTDTSSNVGIVGRQVTVDEGASYFWQLPWMKKNLVNSSSSTSYTRGVYRRTRRMDLGTEFSTRTNRYIENAGVEDSKESPPPLRHDILKGRSGQSEFSFNGELFARSASMGPSDANWPVVPDADLAVLWSLGATAIARTLPTNPVSDAAVFAGELRNDGLPRLPLFHSLQDKVKWYKSLGDEYLNVEFGWKPFVADLQKFALAAHTSHKVLTQYERDSGRGVRRKYAFPTLRTVTRTQLSNGVPSPSLNTSYYNLGQSDQKAFKTRLDITETWFSGCFTYYLNMGDSARDRLARHAQEAKKLFGVRLTPEVLYNLAPWSWAVDWVANIGDVIHNISAFSQDGLVMRYGYIMQRHYVADTYELGLFKTINGTYLKPTTQTFVTEVKVRKKASPYGFGINPASFTAGQISIIAALGLSRLR